MSIQSTFFFIHPFSTLGSILIPFVSSSILNPILHALTYFTFLEKERGGRSMLALLCLTLNIWFNLFCRLFKNNFFPICLSPLLQSLLVALCYKELWIKELFSNCMSREYRFHYILYNHLHVFTKGQRRYAFQCREKLTFILSISEIIMLTLDFFIYSSFYVLYQVSLVVFRKILGIIDIKKS